MKNSQKARKTPARSELHNAITTALKPIPPGLTLVCVRDPTQLAQVRNTMTHEALKKSTVFDVPMPDVTGVLSLHAGPARRVEHAQALAEANGSRKNGIKHKQQLIEAPNSLDWTSDEGLAVVCRIIKNAKGWVMVEQPVRAAISPYQEFGLSKIDAVAKEHGVWVMLFTVQPISKMAELSKHCADYFDVTPCEPDPGFNMAFAVECADANFSGELNIGKVMCCVGNGDGKFIRRYRPFIAPDRRTRLMAMLRKDKKKTLDDIGQIVGLSKSQVSRILSKVPPIKGSKLTKDELRSWLQSCGIDPDNPEPDDSDHDADDQEIE